MYTTDTDHTGQVSCKQYLTKLLAYEVVFFLVRNNGLLAYEVCFLVRNNGY